MSVDITKIQKLEAAILNQSGIPTARKPILCEELETRRYELLSDHLGHLVEKPAPIINVVGDSHSAFFGGCESLVFHKGRRIFTGLFRPRYVSVFNELLPVFRVFHLGPATAWNAYEPRSSTRTYEKINKLLRVRDIPSASKILLVFGEIDIRCQIPNSVSKGRSIHDAVTDTIERFIKLPIELKKRGYDPCIWLPSLIARCHPTDILEREDKNHLPVIGSQESRDEISFEYCKQLSELAKEEGIKSCGIKPTSSLYQESSFIDGHHLSQNLMPIALDALVRAEILKI